MDRTGGRGFLRRLGRRGRDLSGWRLGAEIEEAIDDGLEIASAAFAFDGNWEPAQAGLNGEAAGRNRRRGQAMIEREMIARLEAKRAKRAKRGKNLGAHAGPRASSPRKHTAIK